MAWWRCDYGGGDGCDPANKAKQRENNGVIMAASKHEKYDVTAVWQWRRRRRSYGEKNQGSGMALPLSAYRWRQ